MSNHNPSTQSKGAFNVQCPKCFAVAGYPCLTRSGSVVASRDIKVPHPERTRAAKRQGTGTSPVSPSKGNCVNCHHNESFHTGGARGLGCVYAGCKCSRFRQRLNIA